MRRFRTGLTLTVALATLLTGCGGSDDETSAPAEATTQEATADPSDAGETGAPSDEPAPDDGTDEPVPATEATDQPAADRFLALTSLGIDSNEGVLEFGADPDVTLDLLTSFLGEPVFDGGWVEPFEGGCVGVGATQVRNVGWADTNVLFLDGTDDEGGAPHFAYWFTTDADQTIRAFLGDATELSIRAGATTVGDLRASFNPEDLDVVDEPPYGPYFYAHDNWGELRGEVSTTDDDGFVQSINAGVLCGE